MKRIPPPEDSRRVLAVTLTIWAASVAVGGYEGVFAKLSPATFVFIAFFATAFAAASYALDRGARALVGTAPLVLLAGMALAADALLAITAFAIAKSQAGALASLAQFPFVLAALFVAPLALPLHFALLARRTRGKRLSSAAARSPGASPAAT